MKIVQVETTDVDLCMEMWFREKRHVFMSNYVVKLKSEDLEVNAKIIFRKSITRFGLFLI